MVARCLVLVLVAGCGRLGFDGTPGAPDGAGDAASGDAASGDCPDGFVRISGSDELGTTDFCAMRFEAKARSLANGAIAPAGCDEGCTPNSLITTHAPASVAEGHPWVQIDAVQAQLRCRSLGEGFDVMSNLEWMTIARRAELAGDNWSGGAPGAGRLVEGSTDGSGSGGVTDPNDPYSDTGNSAGDPVGMGWEQRRTLALGDGVVIWDLAGNLQEWIDWTQGGPMDGAPTPCAGNELPMFSCPGIVADQFDSSTGTYDSTHGVGKVIGGDGDATRRGGQRTDLSLGIAGIYGLNMNRFTTDVFPGTSFRCVRR
jgi:hypothetical protein